MPRDNAASRTRGITGCMVVLSTWTETPLPSAGIADRPAAGPAPGWSLAAALLGFFMITLDAVVVNVALPSIRRELGGGITGLQWVVDGYTLMFAALLLSAGALSDRVGARRAFGAGLAVFVARLGGVRPGARPGCPGRGPVRAGRRPPR